MGGMSRGKPGFAFYQSARDTDHHSARYQYRAMGRCSVVEFVLVLAFVVELHKAMTQSFFATGKPLARSLA